MKLLYFLLLVVISSYYVNAKIQDFRHYEEGRLTWEDFTSRIDTIADSTSKFKPYISFEVVKIERNDTTFNTLKTLNFIFYKKAYIPRDKQTNENLRYYQVIFDIKEHYRRELQDTFNITNEFTVMQSEYKRIDSISDSVVNIFKAEFELNNKIETLANWEKLYNIGNKDNKLPLLPDTIIPRYSYSFDVGGRYGFNTGMIHELIEPSYGYYIGFTVYTKDLFFFMRLGTVKGKAKKRFIYEDEWEKGSSMSLTEFGLSVGYPLFYTSFHKLTLFLGWGVHEISKSNDFSTTSHSFTSGLNYDIVLKESVNLVPAFPGFSDKSTLQHILNIRLSLTNLNHEYFKGNSIILSVGYSIFPTRVRVQ